MPLTEIPPFSTMPPSRARPPTPQLTPEAGYLEVELGTGGGLEQDLPVNFTQARLYCTLRCQPATWQS